MFQLSDWSSPELTGSEHIHPCTQSNPVNPSNTQGKWCTLPLLRASIEASMKINTKTRATLALTLTPKLTLGLTPTLTPALTHSLTLIPTHTHTHTHTLALTMKPFVRMPSASLLSGQ